MKDIELKNITVSRDSRVLLDNISVSFESKTLNIIFGPNGAGKTTLLRVISGEIEPDKGTVSLFGSADRVGLKQLGFVAQGVFAKKDFPISVLNTVLMGRYGVLGLFKRPKKHDYDIAYSALEQVGMEAFANRYLGDLSGGERQRVFIARALAVEPKALILDEATSGVDAGARESLYSLLVRLKQQICVVFVTHDMSVVSREVDNVVCLNKVLVSHGKPEVALTDAALKCMYGNDVAMFTHCATPHMHVHKHGQD